MAHHLEFGKAARLTGKNRFGAVFSARKVRTNRLFLIHYAPQTPVSATGARLGVGVSRKVASSAVERNRIRRLIKESFRIRRPQLKINDYVVRARPQAVGVDNAALQQALDELWEWFKRK